MALLVQKFGGTSVGSVERIQAVARRIAASREQGHDLVIVVSAMGHTTDELTSLARALCTDPPQREMDMLLATGEQVSIALLAMALHSLGVPAVSMTGPQVGIVTESAHGRARILEVRTERLRRPPGGWPGGGGGGLPGHQQRQWRHPRDHHPRAWRLRHLRRGPGRRPRRRRLRDLHRCARSAHHRPAQGERGPVDGGGELQRDAGAGQPRRGGAASPRRRDRPQLRRSPGGALQLERGPGHPAHQRGTPADRQRGAGARPPCGRGGSGERAGGAGPHPGARPPGGGRPAVRGPLRGEAECGSDRAGHPCRAASNDIAFTLAETQWRALERSAGACSRSWGWRRAP
jgi:hypothetical protein